MTTTLPDVTAPPMVVRLLTSNDVAERAYRATAVSDPDLGTTVMVRWRIKADTRAWRWKCDQHGTGPDAYLCHHVFSSAVFLAESLLGLRNELPAPSAPAKEEPR